MRWVVIVTWPTWRCHVVYPPPPPATKPLPKAKDRPTQRAEAFREDDQVYRKCIDEGMWATDVVKKGGYF